MHWSCRVKRTDFAGKSVTFFLASRLMQGFPRFIQI
jgi:hypothetical protein